MKGLAGRAPSTRDPRPAPVQRRAVDRWLVLWSAAFVSASLAAAGGAGESELPARVTIEPDRLAPGTPLRIAVDAPPDAEVTGTFLGDGLVFMTRPGGNGWLAFAGIDLDTKPGSYILSVEVSETDGGGVAHAVDVTVETKAYPTEHLSVSPQYVQPPEEVQRRIEREADRLRSIWAAPSQTRLFDGGVVRPLTGVEGRNFGSRRIFNDQPRSPHSGTDLSAPAGTPVEAAATGTVALAEDLYFSGNLVVLDHGGGVYTLYAHLSRIDVEQGKTVHAGEIVGKVGATGRVTGPHLHWGARIGRARVEPNALLELLSF